MPKFDTAFFPSVEGSMTSEDGQTFMLHVKRPAGGDLLLGFPHDQSPTIVENAAVQAGHGKDERGRKTETAFQATGFRLGRGPGGDAALTMVVTRAGAINFLLPGDITGEMCETLRKLAN